MQSSFGQYGTPKQFPQYSSQNCPLIYVFKRFSSDIKMVSSIRKMLFLHTKMQSNIIFQTFLENYQNLQANVTFEQNQELD